MGPLRISVLRISMIRVPGGISVRASIGRLYNRLSMEATSADQNSDYELVIAPERARSRSSDCRRGAPGARTTLLLAEYAGEHDCACFAFAGGATRLCEG